MRKLFLILFFIAPAIYANQLIIEPDMGRAPILNIINSAQRNLKLVMYGLTDKAFLNAIIQQKNTGKHVQIILEKNPYKSEGQNQLAIEALNANHVSWQGKIPGFKLIHQKTLMVDDKTALVMTFNLTYPTFKNQRNFALIIDDPAQVVQINSVFNADWNHTTPVINPTTHCIYSPTNSRIHFANLINHAIYSLQIYAQNISDYQITGLLAKAAKRGVAVQLLTTEKMRAKQYQYLRRAGVKIKFSQKLIIHAKVIIFDANSALIGSINLTRASLDDNRELSVLVKDNLIIRQLQHTFNRDWNQT